MILSGLCWKWIEIILLFLRLHPSTAFQTLVDYVGYSLSSKGFLPTAVNIMVIWVKFTHSSPFQFADSLNVDVQPCHLLFAHFRFARDSWTWHSRFLCSIALHGTGPCSRHQSHPQLGIVFLLPHLFLLSGVISALMFSSILGTYWPGEFIFQGSIFLPFYTVHGVLKARIRKWFASPFSSGPHFVRTLHHDPSVLGGPTQHGLVSLS